MRRPEWTFFLALAACVGPDDIHDANDRDRDGYVAFQAGGDDCDDGDATVNPGADEVCANDVDDDCDGYVDDVGLGAATFYPDVDLDGFGATAAAVEACEAPAAHVTVGGDCNDAVAGVNPDATEVWYDGVDQDCDGADDFDQDADGFPSAEHAVGGTDCDDRIAAVNPDATDTCGNLVDDDCDGDHDGCDWTGDDPVETGRILIGGSVTPRATAGDCDGDGAYEMAVWLPDDAKINLYWGPWFDTELVPAEAMVVLTMPAPQAGYGHVASLEQDLTGDGGADLVVGSWKPGTAGSVVMFEGLNQFLVDFTVAAADRTWTGPTNGSQSASGFGSRVVPLGMVPGATRGSLGIPYLRTSGGYRCALLHDGPTSGIGDAVAVLLLDDCNDMTAGPLRISGETVALARNDVSHHFIDTASDVDLSTPAQPEANLWSNLVQADVLRVLGDVDGDGYDDVAALETNSPNPAVRMPFGPIAADAAPQRTFRLEANPAVIEDFLDLHAADLNGDGLLDLVVLMDLVFTGDPGGTAVGVLFGPLPFEARTNVDRDTFDVVVDLPTGERASSLIPADIDGDGYTDLALPGPGQVRVLYGSGR